MDLGQVEVIKGVASSLYGAGAMGGVVNLISRRPGPEPSTRVPVQPVHAGRDRRGRVPGVAARHGVDGVVARRRPSPVADTTATTTSGRTWQATHAACVRPRVFWDGSNGRSAFLTAGVTIEDREGGTMPDGVLAATGAPYVEALDTERYDVGGTAQALVKGRYVLTARGAAAWQRHDHRFGDVLERDAHDTLFGEVALRGASGAHTWVAGVVFERDDYQPRDVPQFAYTYDVPGVFAQDDFDVRAWLSVSRRRPASMSTTNTGRSSARVSPPCSAAARGPAASPSVRASSLRPR